MTTRPKIKVSKLDAAKRQLETAIRLYFNDADPISILTLAASSHLVLSRLHRKHWGKPSVGSDFLLKDECKKEMKAKISEAKSRLKHKDLDVMVEVDPAVNEIILYDACEKYRALTSEHVPYLVIFQGWFVYNHQAVFTFLHGKNVIINNLMKAYRGNKAEYFSGILPTTGVLK